jgi:hypothetical protein
MTTIKLGSKAKGNVTCSNCGKLVPAGQQFTYKGKNGKDIFFCEECKKKINQQLAEQTENINIPGAILGACLGALIGGIIWYIIELITGYELGYVAIGVAYLVTQGVYIGSGKKKGKSLQIISVIFTLLAIVGAVYLLGVHYLQEALWKKYPDADTIKLILFSLQLAAQNFFQYAISPIGLLT